MTALCNQLQELMFNGPHLAPQNRLGTQCTTLPVQWTWGAALLGRGPLALVRRAAAPDRRLIAIQWTSPNGTDALDQVVTDAHILNGTSALTCE